MIFKRTVIYLNLSASLFGASIARGVPFYTVGNLTRSEEGFEEGSECARALEHETFGPGRVKMQVPGSTEGLILSIPDGVFSGYPLYAYRLVEHAMREIRDRADSRAPVRKVLVVGSGSGYEAIALARAFDHIHVSATDISQTAVHTTMGNAAEHRLIGRVNAWHADLMSDMRARYDLVLFNAPRAVWKSQVEENLNDAAAAVEWFRINAAPEFFDPDGVLLTRFLDQLPARLEPEGSALIMTNEDLRVEVPKGLKDQILSKDPWGSQSLADFAIRRFSKSN